MKKIILICALGLCMFYCSKGNECIAQKRNKTPKHLIMSAAEKNDVNYDARENRKVVDQNLKNKEANMKAARKQREKQTEELKNLNNTSSKVKKRRNAEAFNFY
jgi:hypothetical protein